MPKTSNLRSELLDIQQVRDKSFIVTVSVWESPGDKDSPHANVFAFVSHRNPALWWRLSLYSAMNTGTDRTARYTNAQYNKALRVATDAMNALITRESDKREAAKEAKRTPPAATSVTPNSRLPELTYGTMPDEVTFLMSTADRFDQPFQFDMRLNTRDEVTARRAAELSGVRLAGSGAAVSITSPRDMYKLIQSLWLMREEFEDERAGDLASAILGMAGFNWV